jgi:hypothetical protein
LIAVELAPEVTASLRAMKERGTPPPRALSGGVRPWDLPELQRRAAGLGEVAAARAVCVDEDVLVAEVLPSGQRLVFRGVDDEWRLVRFADDDDVSIRPETTRRVELHGWGPDSVLAALGIAKPDGVEPKVVSEDPGQGETETSHRYQWSDGGRSILAEENKNEIYDGATPYTTYVRGVIVDGDRGVLLTGSGDSALVIEG